MKTKTWATLAVLLAVLPLAAAEINVIFPDVNASGGGNGSVVNGTFWINATNNTLTPIGNYTNVNITGNYSGERYVARRPADSGDIANFYNFLEVYPYAAPNETYPIFMGRYSPTKAHWLFDTDGSSVFVMSFDTQKGAIETNNNITVGGHVVFGSRSNQIVWKTNPFSDAFLEAQSSLTDVLIKLPNVNTVLAGHSTTNTFTASNFFTHSTNYFAQNIYHYADAGTGLQYTSDQVKLIAGYVEFVDAKETMNNYSLTFGGTNNYIRGTLRGNLEIQNGTFFGVAGASQGHSATADLVHEWTVENKDDDVLYTHSTSTDPEELTIEEAGWYRVTYQINWLSSYTNRIAYRCYAEDDGAEISPSDSYEYTRYSTYGHYGSCGTTFLYEFGVDDILTIHSEIICGTGVFGETCNTNTIADESWLIVEKV